MDIEEKKRVASEFIQTAVDPAKRERAFEWMADDGLWGVPLRNAGPPFSKAQILEILYQIDNVFKETPKMTIVGITAEGDRVAIEVEGYAPLTNGTIYNNLYHFLILFSGDKIKEVKEYNDSKFAAETLGSVR